MSEQTISSAGFDQKIIHSNGKRRALYNLFFAIAWNGFVFPVIYFQGSELLKIFKEDPIFWVFVSFPIIGIYFIYSSIGDAIDWFKFGEAPLTLNTFPAYLGGNLSGYIDINTPFEHNANAEVSLRCTHHYIDDSGSESSSASDVLWQDDLLMPSQSQGGKTRVLFSFGIEKDLPQTQGKGSERHEWNVIIKLPVAGKDFVRTYIVSVDKHYAMDQSTGLAAKVSQAMPTLGKANPEASEAVLSPQPLLQAHQGKIKSTHKIPKITTTREGQSYYYPASRNRTIAIVFLIMSLVVGGMSISMLNAFSDFMPVTSTLFSIPLIAVGLALFLASIVILFHRLEVVVGRAGVTVKHHLPFYTHIGRLKPSEIADIQVSRNGSMSSNGGGASKVWYQLKVIDMNGKDTMVGDSLEGSSYAKSIRQQMIDGLGRGWQPTEVVKQPGKIEKLKSLRKSSRFSWIPWVLQLTMMSAIAYDLYNRFRFGGE